MPIGIITMGTRGCG